VVSHSLASSQELLDALCDSLKVDDVTSHPVVRSVLTSLGQIKFLHRGLLDQVTTWLAKRMDAATVKDLVTYLLTTATLNYVPNNSEDLYNVSIASMIPRSLSTWSNNHLQEILQRVTFESVKKDNSSELIWLDVVWSLSVLGKQSSTHLETVLSSDFYNKLLCQFTFG
jgi:hypothetical protein